MPVLCCKIRVNQGWKSHEMNAFPTSLNRRSWKVNKKAIGRIPKTVTIAQKGEVSTAPPPPLPRNMDGTTCKNASIRFYLEECQNSKVSLLQSAGPVKKVTIVVIIIRPICVLTSIINVNMINLNGVKLLQVSEKCFNRHGNK